MKSVTRRVKGLLRDRGYTFEKLARHAGTGRRQLSQSLSGVRPGAPTRLRVSALLEHRELVELGWPAVEPEYSI